MSQIPACRSLSTAFFTFALAGLSLAQGLIENPADASGEWIRYDLDATAFGADPADDGGDDQPAIQRAIDSLAEEGGGVVYLPPGTYELGLRVVVREGVVLRGAWTAPSAAIERENLTVLVTAYDPTTVCDRAGGVSEACVASNPNYNADPEDATHFLLEGSAGMRHLTIYDNLQADASDAGFAPVTRPWVVQQRSSKQVKVEGVTIVNAYNGIQLGPVGNELGMFKDIYLTALNTGFRRDQVFDVARFQRIFIDPIYWKRYDRSVKIAPLRAYTQQHTIGIDFKHFAWTWMYDVSISDANVGVIMNRTGQQNTGARGPCGGFVKLSITNSKNGIVLGDVNDQGLVFTDVSIVNANVAGVAVATLREGSGGERLGEFDENFRAVAQFNNLRTSGGSLTRSLLADGRGNLSFSNCTFGAREAGGSDLEVNDGNVVVAHSRFLEDNQSGSNLLLAGSTAYVTLVDDSWVSHGKPSRERAELSVAAENGADPSSQVVVDGRDVPTRFYGGSDKEYAYDDFTYEAGRRELFNVRDAPFDAAGDGERDDRGSIQRAIDAASEGGGGIVFLPAGQYRIESGLVIRPGVELRGVSDMLHYTNTKTAGPREPNPTTGAQVEVFGNSTKELGSVIHVAFGGVDVAGGEFSAQDYAVAMRANSGIRGLSFWYPEQMWGSYRPAGYQTDQRSYTGANARKGGFRVRYPHTIQANADDVSIRDVTLVNAYRGVLIGAGSDNYHVVGLQGTVFDEGLRVSGSNGHVRDVTFNWTFWRRASALASAPTLDVYSNAEWGIERFAAYRTFQGLDAFVLSDATAQQWLHCFVFKPKNGFTVEGDTDGYLVAIGSDESETAIRFRGGGATRGGTIKGDLNVVNGQFVSQKSPFDKRAIRVEASVGERRVNLFNTLTWGNRPATDGGLSVDGGDVVVQNISFEKHSEVKPASEFATPAGGFYGVRQRGGTLVLTAPFYKRPVGAANSTVWGKYFGFSAAEGTPRAHVAGYYWDAPPQARREADAVDYVTPGLRDGRVEWYPTWCVNERRGGCAEPPLALRTSITGDSRDGVYPNPAAEALTVRWEEGEALEFDYALSDVNGQLLARGHLRSGQAIPTAELAAGAYVLALTDLRGRRKVYPVFVE